ncbi:hypothetical protein K9L05_03230 [Candidatus Babeliales bacterium]|nr:hypothetical protein [Candidatus Babeliales bacterium]MCF7899634.1 hypothetical protein [Candidatus Babeliales bacterium]
MLLSNLKNLKIIIFSFIFFSAISFSQLFVMENALFVKVKCICEDGMHLYNFLISNGAFISDDSPVIVIEGISDYGLTIQEINDVKKRCPHNFSSKKNRFIGLHPLCEFCCLCKKHEDENCFRFLEQKEMLQESIIRNPYDFILKISTSFMQQYQKSYYDFLLNEESHLPIIKSELEYNAQNLDGFSVENNNFFFIEHIHTDLYGHAKNSARLVDKV